MGMVVLGSGEDMVRPEGRHWNAAVPGARGALLFREPLAHLDGARWLLYRKRDGYGGLGVFGNPIALAVVEKFFFIRVVLQLDGLEAAATREHQK